MKLKKIGKNYIATIDFYKGTDYSRDEYSTRILSLDLPESIKAWFEKRKQKNPVLFWSAGAVSWRNYREIWFNDLNEAIIFLVYWGDK